MAGKATVNFVGDRGTARSPHVGKCVINEVTDKASMVTLADALEAYTLCNRGKASFSDVDDGTPSAPEASANVDEKAVIYYKEEGQVGVSKITIPAWDIVTHPLEADGAGDRIASADVAAVVALIATATGKTLSGLWGKHIKVT